MTARQAAAELKRRRDGLRLGLRQAVQETALFALNEAVRPVINVRSGAFRAAWEAGPLEETGSGFRVTVRNPDPKAEQYLARGTRLMFARPLAERVQAAVDRELPERAAAELRRFGFR